MKYADDLHKALQYAKQKAESEAAGFIRKMFPNQYGTFDTVASQAASDWFADRDHPLGELLKHTPDRIYADSLRQGRGPSGDFSYFRPLAVEHGFLIGTTSTGLTHNFAGIKLHAIPLNPDYKGKSPATALTRQSLNTKVLPFSFNKVMGKTATREFTDKLPEGQLKAAMRVLLHGDVEFHDRFHSMQPLVPEPQTDAEFHANIHTDTADDTHADRYGEWLEQQGDPAGHLIRSHVRQSGQPWRHNTRDSLYSNHTFVDHRGGKLSVSEPRMHNGVPMVSVEFRVPHSSPENYPRHPDGHLVPAWLSWRQFMPVKSAAKLLEPLPEATQAPLQETLAKTPKGELED